MAYARIAAAALACIPAACASVVDGSTQPISIATAPEVGAKCTLTNKRGEWIVVTPGTVSVKRSESTLRGRCVKEGYDEGTAYIAAETDNVSLVGMLVPYVGLVETAVDASTGATSKYPSSYTIKMKAVSPSAQPVPSTPAMSGKAAPEPTQSGAAPAAPNTPQT